MSIVHDDRSSADRSSSQSRSVQGAYGPDGGWEEATDDRAQSAWNYAKRDVDVFYPSEQTNVRTYDEYGHTDVPTSGAPSGMRWFRDVTEALPHYSYVNEPPPEDLYPGAEPRLEGKKIVTPGGGGGVNPFTPSGGSQLETITDTTLDDPLWQAIDDDSFHYDGAAAVGRLADEQARQAADAGEPGDEESSWLDNAQTTLDVAGFAPGVGAVPDLVNAGISAGRGNWGAAGLSAVAAIPVVEWFANGGKITKFVKGLFWKSDDAAKAVKEGLQQADELADAGGDASRFGGTHGSGGAKPVGDVNAGSGLARSKHDLAVSVLRGDKSRLELLKELSSDEINQMAHFYRQQANRTAGKFKEAARQFNLERARYLEQGGPRPPGNLREFMKRNGLTE